MTYQKLTVNSLSYDLKVRKSWVCELVSETDELIQAVGVFDKRIEHPDLGIILPGTRSFETFYRDKWFNRFDFFLPDGTPRNSYFNICMPPVIEGSVLSYVDLDVDVVVWPDGRVYVLDIEDFDRSEAMLGYPPEIRKRAFATLDGLLEIISSEWATDGKQVSINNLEAIRLEVHSLSDPDV